MKGEMAKITLEGDDHRRQSFTFMEGQRFFSIFPNHIALMAHLYNWLCNITIVVYDSSEYHGTGFLATKILILSKMIRGARWLSGRVSDSGARGRGLDTYRRRVVSLSKTLYSPKVLRKCNFWYGTLYRPRYSSAATTATKMLMQSSSDMNAVSTHIG